PWGMGQRPFSVRLRAKPGPLVIIDAHAGMVLLAHVRWFSDRTWNIVEAAALVEPAAGCWSAAHADPGSSRPRSGAFSSGAKLEPPPSCVAAPCRLASSRTARGSAARARSARIGTLELEALRPRSSTAKRSLHLERAVGCG